MGYGNSMGSMASMFGLVLGGVLFELINTNLFLLGSIVFLLIFLLMTYSGLKQKFNRVATTEPAVQ